MNTRLKLSITTTLFFLTIIILSLKPQRTLAQQDTTRVIVVVRPGQNNYAKSPANSSSFNTSQTSAYTASALSSDTALNTNSKGAWPNTQIPSTALNTTIQKVKLHRHGAPTLSERAGRPSYMDPPEKNTDTVAETTLTTISTSPIVFNSAIAKKSVTQPPVKIYTIVKKDTVYIEKRDTIFMPPKKHTSNKILFAEVGGPGLAISLNYDQRFSNQKDGWGYRVGMGYFGDGGNTVFTIPLQINYLLGSKGKYFEFGGGTTFLNSTGDNTGKTFIFDRVTGFIGTATIGVRYEPEKSMNFRLGFVPIFTDEGIIYAGGFSIGYTF